LTYINDDVIIISTTFFALAKTEGDGIQVKQKALPNYQHYKAGRPKVAQLLM